MKIWAHRGCSQRYPENTQIAFEKAMEIKNLEGIELDVQMSRDGELVVIHDERVDRTTEGIGYVKDYTLSELKRLHIYADEGPSQSILTMSEVSLEKIRRLEPEAEIGILDEKVSDCLFKLKGCGADALHPFWRGMDLPKERLEGYTVRGWFLGHLYPEKPTGTKLDLEELERQGITDVFLNEPEVYVGSYNR